MSLPQDPTRLSPHIGTSRSPRSPPSPHFDDPPVVPPDEPPDGTGDRALFNDDADEDIPYPEPDSEQTLLPPPNFNPFFTLIEDSTSGEHYHPYVHYVFADDDPVITTAAAMRSLGLDETHYLPQNTPEREAQSEEEAREGGDEEEREPQVESPLPPPIPGAKERYLIVDLAADGHTIVDAQSLSPAWQITNAQVRTAPSFDEGSPEQGYMLGIEGVEVPSKSKGKAKGAPGDGKLQEARDRAGGDIFGALDGLVKGIEGSLDVAGKITGAREDVRESDRTVLVATTVQDEDKGQRKLSQA
ncbi:hypothetical protein BDV96DRAFT_501772 [Lophiotrema nucula]|uniref:Uncharacterized protein n=1 Tax=Lophiotrema nucula TaxID=690887 RepID=A0A6A5YSN8_9PLEO|nr:hypothetical protein BDV96DRAFT_501772 [Lophiotrema nucula]